jgi:hypothetical protein
MEAAVIGNVYAHQAIENLITTKAQIADRLSVKVSERKMHYDTQKLQMFKNCIATDWLCAEQTYLNPLKKLMRTTRDE